MAPLTVSAGGPQLTKVYVTANRISSYSLEVDVTPASTAVDLKYQIEKLWKVPVSCQRLIIGVSELHDFDLLSNHRKPGAEGLSVKMIVVLDLVLYDLASSDAFTRQTALAVLAQLGTAGGEKSIAAIESCLEDRKADVRYAALRALPLVVERGNSTAVAAVCRQLEDGDIGVRKAAAEVLLQVANKDDEIVVITLCQCLEHRDCGVRNAAVELLAKLADKGNEVAMWEIGLRLENTSPGVRRIALQALAQVCPDGHEGAIAAIRMFIEDSDAGVRKAAAAALAEVGTPLYPAVDPDCPEAYDMLEEMRTEYVLKLALTAPDDVALEVSNIDGKPLVDGDATVVLCPRGHALLPLGTAVDDGWICDGSTHPSGCCSGITDFHQTTGMRRFRCGACDYDLCQKCADMKAKEHAVASTASKKAMLDAARTWRNHPIILGRSGEPIWRPELSYGEQDPADVLPSIREEWAPLVDADRTADDSDDDVPPLLDVESGTLVHEDEAEKENESEEDDDMPGLLEEDEPGDEVADNWLEREAELQALATEAERGDIAAITAVGQGLEDRNERVRRTALEVLTELADEGDATVIQVVSEKLKHTDAFIRRDAVTALALVSEQGDENSISMVAGCLQDSHACVRNAATEALAVLDDKREIDAMGMASASSSSSADIGGQRLLVKSGIQAVTQVVQEGSERVITAMSERLETELNLRNKQSEREAIAEVATIQEYNEQEWQLQGFVEHEPEIIGAAALLAISELITDFGV